MTDSPQSAHGSVSVKTIDHIIPFVDGKEIDWQFKMETSFDLMNVLDDVNGSEQRQDLFN